MMAERHKPGELALRVGVAGVIGVGAVLTGLFISRRGRHLIREAWEGRRRSRIEDRVLDAFWGDAVLGRRRLEVAEGPDGTVTIAGVVRSARERRLAVRLARQVHGVDDVVDHVIVRRREPRRQTSSR